MFERYTEGARRIIFFARYEASTSGSSLIETEHLLLGLIRQDQSLMRRLKLSVTYDAVRLKVESASRGAKTSTSADLPLSNQNKRILAYAAEEAERLQHRHIGCEHLLLGLLREKGSFAAELLQEAGLSLEHARASIAEMPVPWGQPRGRHLIPGRPMVEIHGSSWDRGYIEAQIRDCQRFFWQKKPFQAPDLVLHRSDHRLSFDLSLAEDISNFELVKGGWKEPCCRICYWEFEETDNPERGIGYSNGRDWVCTECYEKFVAPEHTQES